jgi:hypothetical protein
MRTVSTEYVVAIARKMLARKPAGTITVEQIAKACGCGVVRARNAMQSHGYEFHFNVGFRTYMGMSGELPIGDWTIEWSPEQRT